MHGEELTMRRIGVTRYAEGLLPNRLRDDKLVQVKQRKDAIASREHAVTPAVPKRLRLSAPLSMVTLCSSNCAARR